MTRIVGLSGGIGSGKSTVAALFAELGATVIDADAIVHELQAPGSPVLVELADAFGSAILDADGALDRDALGQIVFRDADARKRLGSIMHPRVGVEMMKRLAVGRESGAPLIVLDIPLLFEGIKAGSGISTQLAFDATIVVYVPEPLQIERQLARDSCTPETAKRRVEAQLSIEEKKHLADFVIDNSGSFDATRDQVRELFSKLTAADAGPDATGP
jgi:dephospho-CoA kinase